MSYISATEQTAIISELKDIHNLLAWVATGVAILVILHFIRIIREF